MVATNARGHNVTAADLWQNTTALMTDAVSKNLNVHRGISDALATEYVPLHLLCKSHTVEGLDRSNIQVLAEVERAVQLREKIEAVNPAIKRFTRGDKSVVITGIKSVLNLVSHEKSASPTNLAHLFDAICEREGAVKHMSLYQERRFAKLGYVAGSILDAIPLLTMLLNEAPNHNLHTESVRIYLECEFFSTALAVLSYFSYKVSLPLLNCVEQSSQTDLCKILPKLHTDLLSGNTDTLSSFVVKRTHFDEPQLSSNLEKLLLMKFCIHAAAVIKLQCGREYFPDETSPARATQIFALSEEDQEGLPTNNLLPECDFSVFDRISKVAKMANKKFTATNIRNDMTLLHSNTQLTETAKKSARQLAEREATWNEGQKRLRQENDMKKSEKAKGVHAYQRRVLQNCKTWGGPCVSVDDLNQALLKAPDEAFCVTQELTYYKLSHPTEYSANRHLFRVRGINHEEKMDNLRYILSNEEDLEANKAKVGRLPSNKDVLAVLQSSNSHDEHRPEPRRELTVFINSVVAVIWIVNDRKTWYLGYITDLGDDDGDTYTVDHLERLGNGNDLWRFPKKEDMCGVDIRQVIGIKPDYEWDVRNIRTQKMRLKNHKAIDEAVKNANLTNYNGNW